MNNGLKWGLILGSVTFVGVGAFYVLKNRKDKSSTSSDSNNNVIPNLSTEDISASAQNGKIVIKAGNNTFTYALQGYKFTWWTIDVNNIDLDTNQVTYTNPQSKAVLTEPLEEWVINDIKNGLGQKDISMGETSDGTKIRLTKV